MVLAVKYFDSIGVPRLVRLELLDQSCKRAMDLLEDSKSSVLAVAHAPEINLTVTGEDMMVIVDRVQGTPIDGWIYADPALLEELEEYCEHAAVAHQTHLFVNTDLPAETVSADAAATVGLQDHSAVGSSQAVEEIVQMSEVTSQIQVAEPGVPGEGWSVLHLFFHVGSPVDKEQVVGALRAASGDGYQVVTASLMGHKADFAVMALGPDLARLRRLQSELQGSGLFLVDSYVSLTEVSEYAKDVPQDRKIPRLYPVLPPAGKRAFCFYPMSKRRHHGANWYMLSYEDREKLMAAHGTSGRKFGGRIVQLITGSTGLDAFEWGVTLFGQRIDDIKEVVYTLRFDEVSAVYGEFGPFYVGIVDEPAAALGVCLLGSN